jgi:hypothetical protein
MCINIDIVCALNRRMCFVCMYCSVACMYACTKDEFCCCYIIGGLGGGGSPCCVFVCVCVCVCVCVVVVVVCVRICEIFAELIFSYVCAVPIYLYVYLILNKLVCQRECGITFWGFLHTAMYV